MTPEVQEIFDALIHPSKAAYEALRKRVIDAVGYEAFRDRQCEAFNELGRMHANAFRKPLPHPETDRAIEGVSTPGPTNGTITPWGEKP
jgi:hypothetical protein